MQVITYIKIAVAIAVIISGSFFIYKIRDGAKKDMRLDSAEATIDTKGKQDEIISRRIDDAVLFEWMRRGEF